MREHQIERLRWVVIPPEWQSIPRSEEVRIEVTPITDSWLITKERSWEEVDGILEGRLQDLQSKKEVGGNLARFLALVELTDEYRLAHDHYLASANTLRDRYEQEKTGIRQNTKGRFKTERRIAELYRTTFNPEIGRLTQRANETKAVENLILRKAVIDLFSAEDPLVAVAFPKLVDEARETFQSPRPVDYFLIRLGSYLANTQDEALFDRYAYRKSPNLISTIQDCQVLDAMLNFSFDTANLETSPATADKLERLGHAFFQFLKNRAVSLSQRGTKEPYPIVSAISDVLTAALYRGKSAVLRQVAKLTDANFLDLVGSPIIRAQMKQLVSRWMVLMDAAVRDFENQQNLLLGDPKTRAVIERIPESVVNLLSSEEHRLLIGLEVAYKGLTGPGIKSALSKSLTMTRLHQLMIEERKILAPPIPLTETNQDFLAEFISGIPRSTILAQRGVEVDLFTLSHGEAKEASNLTLATTSKENRLGYLRRTLARLEGHDRLTIEREMLLVYIERFWNELGFDSRRTERENNYLWHEILNNPDWFVSPRGDRFSARNDNQLPDLSFSSVAFYTDRKYPREHKAIVRLTGLDFAFEIWLDTYQNLFGFQRQILSISPEAKQTLANFLLKRLYFISSGLSASEIIAGGEERGGPSFEYRRAHYRHLLSTDRRPIAMESHGAQVHAKDVLEDYGIDIFGEIRRRRAIGTLKPNEYLTFVREVTPEVVDRLVLPNELIFKPEQIIIPV